MHTSPSRTSSFHLIQYWQQVASKQLNKNKNKNNNNNNNNNSLSRTNTHIKSYHTARATSHCLTKTKMPLYSHNNQSDNLLRNDYRRRQLVESIQSIKLVNHSNDNNNQKNFSQLTNCNNSLTATATYKDDGLDARTGRVVPASIIMEDTAGALVGFVRLSLVILICVLLVKLRSVKSGQQKRRKSIESTKSTGSLLDNYQREEVDRETEISKLGLISSNNLEQNDNKFKQQHQRRHSQPTLQVPNGSLAAQRADERRRRHSDTTAAISKLQLPPGPMGLPFLGYLPFLGNGEIHLTLTDLSRRYGPIYQIFLGGIRVVVLNDASLVRQAFKQTVFSGRPDTQLTRILQGYGIVNSEGALWREQRAFLHSALRKLGAKSLMSGSNGLEAKIQNQVKEFVGDLSVHAREGKPCQVRPMVARAVSSVVGSIVMNLTYRKYEEKEKFDRLIELMQEGFRLFSIAMPLDFMPLFKYLPGVNYAYTKMLRNRAETSAFFQTVADEHRKYLSKTFNLGVPNPTTSLHPATAGVIPTPPTTVAPSIPSSLAEPKTSVELEQVVIANSSEAPQPTVELESIVARDLVDAYIVQQKKHEKDGKENYFSDQQLVQIMSDIFSAGLETVTSTIEWSILFLILNVECQEKIQEEIDRQIGRNRSPQLEDLAQMPYTEATIYEVLRRSNVITLGNAHATLADASIGGYLIPKGTQVLPNLYGIHMDPKLWEQPDQFNPNRFISNERAHKPDYFIPFSTGRRMCLGDVLAKMEVFLFLVGLLQKYDLAVHEDDRNSPPQVKGTIGVSNAPVPYRVALNLRNKTQVEQNHNHCHHHHNHLAEQSVD